MKSTGIPEDMKHALTKFDAIADQIAREFVGGLELQKAPAVVYHYTNDKGLRGILETGQLWLSDIFSLNDPSELSHGFSHVVKILNEKAAGGPGEARIFAKHFSDFLGRGMEGSAHYFVCSFSSDGDDLGQWRSYADNGRGYALGFAGKSLEDAFTRDNGVPIVNASTHHVTYNDAVLIDIHSRMVDNMFDLISLPRGRRLDEASISAYMMQLSVSLSLHALRAALFFKHEAYRNEKEFRFMQVYPADVPAPEVKRRYRSYELVKYREFDWNRLRRGSLKQVIVGPAADRSKAARFLTQCLDTFKYSGVEVDWSKIPYRAVE